MKKKIKTITITTIWIASACAIAMFGTLLSDHLYSIGWFNDNTWTYDHWGSPATKTEWGMRHVWYAWTFAILFIGSVVNAVLFAVNSFNNP